MPMLAGHLPSLHMHPNLTVQLATNRNAARCNFGLLCAPTFSFEHSSEQCAVLRTCVSPSCDLNNSTAEERGSVNVQTSSAMALRDILDAVGPSATELTRSSLRTPSGLGSYEAFLRSNSGAGTGGRHVANLKALSGVIPKMQVQPNKKFNVHIFACLENSTC